MAPPLYWCLRGGVTERDLCRRSYIGVCRGGVTERDLCRRIYIAVCRGGVCVSDLCQVRVSYKSVTLTVSIENVLQECQISSVK